MTTLRRSRWLPASAFVGGVLLLSLVGACDSDKDGEGCNTSAECGGGICRDGVCVQPCTSNEACALGQLCNVESGVCYTRSTPPTGAGGGSAGAPVSVAGSFSAGAAPATGAAGSSGAATAGSSGAATAGATGTGGAGGMSGSGGSAGAPVILSYDLIDDLEDNDARIIQGKGRQGPWHIFNDKGNGDNQQPSNSNFLPEKGGANATMYAVHTSGEGFGFAGVGFDLNNAETTPESSKSQPFDASAWEGIAFWAKGTGTLRIEIPTRNFVPQDRGGNCTNDCWNVYGGPIDAIGAEWREYRIPFATLERESGSTMPAFARSQLMSISFRHNGNTRFDFWIDEVRFYSTSSGGSMSTGGASGGGAASGGAATGGAATGGAATGGAGSGGAGPTGAGTGGS